MLLSVLTPSCANDKDGWRVATRHVDHQSTSARASQFQRSSAHLGSSSPVDVADPILDVLHDLPRSLGVCRHRTVGSGSRGNLPACHESSRPQTSRVITRHCGISAPRDPAVGAPWAMLAAEPLALTGHHHRRASFDRVDPSARHLNPTSSRGPH